MRGEKRRGKERRSEDKRGKERKGEERKGEERNQASPSDVMIFVSYGFAMRVVSRLLAVVVPTLVVSLPLCLCSLCFCCGSGGSRVLGAVSGDEL